MGKLGEQKVNCIVCGREVTRKKSRGRIPEYHAECKRFRNYFDAAIKALEEVCFEGPEQAQNVAYEVHTIFNDLQEAKRFLKN